MSIRPRTLLGLIRLAENACVALKFSFASGPWRRMVDGAIGVFMKAVCSLHRFEIFWFTFGLLAASAGAIRAESASPRVLSRSPHTLLSRAGQLEIVRQPAPMVFPRNRADWDKLPAYDAASGKYWQIDLRSRDVSAIEMANRLVDLRHADFDSRTRWPARLPDGYSPTTILVTNRNPGLGLRALHARGINGAGVGVGIIDQELLVDHVEYRERLRCYEEVHVPRSPAQMHGPAVASIAVGKSVGVAPGADLYYIAEMHGDYSGAKFELDFTWLAKSIDRLLEINATLPSGRKIRVISVSVGWGAPQKGFAAANAAVQRATQAGVFVVSTAIERTHRLSFHGLGRDFFADPERPDSYRPGGWWAEAFWDGRRFAPGTRLLVPMDSRAVASPTGPDDYVFYADGGWSWSVPWIAGLYALACQVSPEITPAVFWAEALRTGTTTRLKRGNEEIDFGSIANPAALLHALQVKAGGP